MRESYSYRFWKRFLYTLPPLPLWYKYIAQNIYFPCILQCITLISTLVPVDWISTDNAKKQKTHGKHTIGATNFHHRGWGGVIVELLSKFVGYNFCAYYEVRIVFLTCFLLNNPNSRLITSMIFLLFLCIAQGYTKTIGRCWGWIVKNTTIKISTKLFFFCSFMSPSEELLFQTFTLVFNWFFIFASSSKNCI